MGAAIGDGVGGCRDGADCAPERIGRGSYGLDDGERIGYFVKDVVVGRQSSASSHVSSRFTLDVFRRWRGCRKFVEWFARGYLLLEDRATLEKTWSA